ncbi:tail fiber domain-containing protein [Aeromonas popoffii]|uniref:tail fiber domain-containing protein n=1 Tax=Aeromonas popoffii TaxID=70856 RepID=UPI000693E36A|nr:glycosyl hydrolase family 28-related protein [Aeromonas popoffii]
MSDYRGYVTKAGFAFEAVAAENEYPVIIGKILIGDGFLPDGESPSDVTALVHKIKEFPAEVFQDKKNRGQYIARCTIPANDSINGEGYYIREMAAELTGEGEGIIYAYRRVSNDFKPLMESGEVKSYIYQLRFIPDNAENISVSIDANSTYITRDEFDEHRRTPDHPHATSSEFGMVRLAESHEGEGGSGVAASQDSLLQVAAEAKHGAEAYPLARRLIEESLYRQGLMLAPGSFEEGSKVTNEKQAVLSKKNAVCFVFTGEIPPGGFDVKKGTEPAEPLWKQVKALNILDFGAKGDGADDWNAIQAAVTLLRKVYVPDGHFAVGKTVRVPSHTVIIGSGKDRCRIYALPSMPGELDVVCNENYGSPTLRYDRNIIIHGVDVDGNGFERTKEIPTEWGRSIRLAAVFDCLIHQSKLTRGPQHCLDITNYNDSYIGIGHNGKIIGPSFNVVVSGTDIEDYCYDDGITTHASHNILIDDISARITDYAKSKTEYVATQNAIEIDDGSSDVVVTRCRADANNTNSKCYAVATHKNAPAAHNIKFEDIRAHGCVTAFQAWADTDTDAIFKTIDWKCRNITVKNLTVRGPALNQSSNVFPSRLVDIQGFMGVNVDDVKLYMKDDAGIVHSPIAVTNLSFVHDVKLSNFYIRDVIDGSLNSAVYKDSSWLRIVNQSSEVSIDGMDIDNLGFVNRIITDSECAALVSVDRVSVQRYPSDGSQRIGVVSAAKCNFGSVSVPPGMLPLKIGRWFKDYPSGRYKNNQGRRDVVIGGIEYISETLDDSVQDKPGITFDNQFYSGTLRHGKGSVAFKTSNAKERGFSVCSYHEDSGEYRPILAAWDRSWGRSIEPGLDNDTTLGRPERRFKQGYFASDAIVVSDGRKKTNPLDISNKLLDAWGEVSFKEYLFKSAVEEKGEAARKHIGLIAQEIERVFKEHDLNAFEYGLLCYDEWEAQYVHVEKADESGELVTEMMLVEPAGNIYGVRYDEALALDAAYHRRELKLIKDRILKLEQKILG